MAPRDAKAPNSSVNVVGSGADVDDCQFPGEFELVACELMLFLKA